MINLLVFLNLIVERLLLLMVLQRMLQILGTRGLTGSRVVRILRRLRNTIIRLCFLWRTHNKGVPLSGNCYGVRALW
jgi:hypothetical protein